MNLRKPLLWLSILPLLTLIALGGAFWYINSHKDVVNAYLLKTAKNAITGQITVGNFQWDWTSHFPLMTVNIHEVTVSDTMVHVHGAKLLEAKKVGVSLNTWKLLFAVVSVQQIDIQGVHVHLLKQANGYDNSAIFKSTSASTGKTNTSTPQITINKLSIQDLQFLLEDEMEGKRISFALKNAQGAISPTDTALHFTLLGKAHTDGLTFLKVFGPYLSNADVDLNIHGHIASAIPKIVLHNSSATILQAEYQINGWIIPSKEPSLDLHISSDTARLGLVVPYLTDTIVQVLKNIQVEKPVKGHMRIFGPLLPKTDPHVDLVFSTQHNTVSYQGVPLTLTGVSFHGRFHNYRDSTQAPSDPNSLMRIEDFKGNLGTMPIEARAEIEDFIRPKLSIQGAISDKLEHLDAYTSVLPVDNLQGNIAMDFSIRKLDIMQLSNKTMPMAMKGLSGHIGLKNVAFTYKSSSTQIKSLDADLSIKDDSIRIKNLALSYGGNAMQVSGKFQGLIPYLIQPTNQLQAKLQVYSKNFIVDRLLSKPLPPSQKHKTKIHVKYNSLAESYAHNLHFQIHLKADRLQFRKLEATNVKGLIIHTGTSTEVKSLELNTLDGKIGIQGKLAPILGPNMIFTSNIRIQHVDIHRLFSSMDNFNQKVITSKNIEGKFSAKIRFSTHLKSDFSIQAPSMAGNFDFQLQKGRLKDFDPLIMLSNFVFKKRHLNNIEFDNLSNQIQLQGQQITIPEMPIITSAFSFYIKGNYNFKDSTHMEIKVPFSNFAKWEPNVDQKQQFADSSKTNLVITAKTVNKKLRLGFGL